MMFTVESNAKETLGNSDHIKNAPTVLLNKSCYETLRILRSYPESSYVVVCDKLDRPVGLVSRDKFFMKMNSPVGIDLFYREKIGKLMSRMPLIMDVNLSIEVLLATITKRPVNARNESIIVTKQGKYAGIIESHDIISS